ncbi:hypothetical protein [Acinetobacter nematophilus]|uniref:Uncharacterized protein n=1 Tax=Acinetobacter nematophilus TaxID=2994642 RepID=A0A9X3DQE5_9GAMM|nr:hypothetical protein [Acinetobacter nematophilus]MCX5466528.1 hypothetical protein [Acinetobacter nematophilus]
MKTMRITSAEERMVLQHRASIKHEKATERFQNEILKMAYEFSIFLNKEGLHPSFSEFINCFDPPHHQYLNNLKYDSVIKVMDTIKSLELPKENSI